MTEEEAFDAFARDLEPKLWRALVALVGPQAASDASADALIYAWRHWDRVQSMANPAGYLYRVARRSAVRRDPGRDPVGLPVPSPADVPDVEPGLLPALRQLSEMQRSVVWLVEGCGWTVPDTARLLDVSVSTVRNHLSRGLKHLRTALKVNTDV